MNSTAATSSGGRSAGPHIRHIPESIEGGRPVPDTSEAPGRPLATPPRRPRFAPFRAEYSTVRLLRGCELIVAAGRSRRPWAADLS